MINNKRITISNKKNTRVRSLRFGRLPIRPIATVEIAVADGFGEMV